MSKGTINNGKRLEVSFGGYSGRAGVVERPDRIDIAFRARYSDIRDVTTGIVDGKPVTVQSVERSQHVDGMVVVTAVTQDG